MSFTTSAWVRAVIAVEQVARDAAVAVEAANRAAADALLVPLSQKGAASGVASLDGGGKIPVGQLPAAVMTYEGTWDAASNTPTLADGVGSPGQVYRVSVAGSQNLGSGVLTFEVGDYAVANASTVWEKSDTTDAVASVAGLTGVITSAALKTALAIAEADVTNLTTDLAGKQPIDSDLTTIASITPANDDLIQRKAGAWTNRSPAQVKTDLALTKSDVGLGNVDNTADTAKPVSTAQQTAIDGKVADAINDGTTTIAPSQNAVFDALALKAPLASPALTGNPTAPTPSTGDADTSIATTGFVAATLTATTPQLSRWTGNQSNTSYTIPTGMVGMLCRAKGPGAGGGSGRRGATLSNRSGGAGGAGGGYAERWIWASDLGGVTTLYIDCATGGAGGAAVTTDSTDGNPGGLPTRHSAVKTSNAAASNSNTLVYGTAPTAAAAGGSTANVTGPIAAQAQYLGGNGGGGNIAAGGVGTAGLNSGVGGGGGGGIDTTNTASAGGATFGSRQGTDPTLVSGGTVPGGAGTAGTIPPSTAGYAGGGAGSGGAAHATGVGGTGGAGAIGSGGGGGGASLNGNNSGAGGAGGDGFVEIVAFFM